MKKIKKIAAIAMAMALTVGSCVSVSAMEKTKFEGEIGNDDLQMALVVPTNAGLTIKPYTGTQIISDPVYFTNNEATPAAVGDDMVSYTIGLAGYTCVATSKTADSPIKAAETLPGTGTAKNITVKLELGQQVDIASQTAVEASQTALDTTGAAAQFKKDFTSKATLAVTKLSETSYDGTASSTYTKNTATENNSVTVSPKKAVPFRITGTMNTSATWEKGDKITVVPVFSVDISVEQAKASDI